MNKGEELGPFVVRVVLGLIMLAHGGQKLLNMNGTVEIFTQQIGLPAILAYAIAMIETFAGASLILGFFVRTSAFLIGGIMLGAIATLKFKAGFFGNSHTTGYEYNLALLAMCVLLTLHPFKTRKERHPSDK